MRALVAALCLAAGAAAAAPPETSIRPMPRPVRGEAAAEEIATAVAFQRATSPAPALPAVAPAKPSAPNIVAVARNLVALSPRPEVRPENLRRRSTVQSVGLQIRPPGPVAGSICGNAGIRGERMQPIPGRIPACGVAQPVRVTSVAGIRLSEPAIMDCPTAQALHSWTENAVKPVMGRLGGGVVGLKVAAHYSCRPRNNQAGAKVSEHGRGRAIDIAGIQLANGQTVTVLEGWRSGQHGKRLRSLHGAACGPFGTVLGPNSDGFHRDHFHLDTASYRSGTYCK